MFQCCWGWLQIYGQGLRCFHCLTRDSSFDSVKRALLIEYNKMGRMTFAEVVVMVNFIILAILWVTRDPGFIPGWGLLFKKGYVKDSTPAIFIACVLFVLPAQVPRWMVWWRRSSSPAIVRGSFALADGCHVSGLSKWMSSKLEGVSHMAPWITGLILSTFIAMATEVTSNSATTTLFVPIVGQLAVKVGVHPLYFMIPCTIAASLAFLLPVATPPNAIVFASGYLRVRDMVLGGIPMNLMSLVVLNLAMHIWVATFLDLSHLPDIFQPNTSTTASTLPFATTLP
ncbi:hypothetical protein ACOMHN_061696 [Nucella lapillus]